VNSGLERQLLYAFYKYDAKRRLLSATPHHTNKYQPDNALGVLELSCHCFVTS
jgi:hypothetical protein